MNRQLAKISKARLEIKERGILCFWIYVNYENGCGQAVGGFALDSYSDSAGRRVGTAYGCEMIRQLLLTLNVDDFSEMVGKHVWVIGDGDGFGFKPKGIQRLHVDGGGDALVFSDVLAQFSEEESQ